VGFFASNADLPGRRYMMKRYLYLLAVLFHFSPLALIYRFSVEASVTKAPLGTWVL
jgi:hypothetical protein